MRAIVAEFLPDAAFRTAAAEKHQLDQMPFDRHGLPMSARRLHALEYCVTPGRASWLERLYRRLWMIVRVFVLAACLDADQGALVEAEQAIPAITAAAPRDDELAFAYAPPVLLAVYALDASRSASAEPSRAARELAADREHGSLADWLGSLVLTEDLDIPGASGLALRLIPTRSALAGASAPVVIVPRVVATTWYGAQVVLRF